MISYRLAIRAALLAGVVGFAACSSMPGMSSSNMMTMKNALTGAQEVPAVQTSGSGSVDSSFDKSSKTLSWTVTYSGLSGPVTAGHIHGPAAPGANAGVVIPFTGDLSSPIKGKATLTDAQVADLMAGRYYVNLHTAKNPGGEVRAQLTAK